MRTAISQQTACLVLNDIDHGASRKDEIAVSTLMHSIVHSGANITVLYVGRPDTSLAIALTKICEEQRARIEVLPETPLPIFPPHMRQTVEVFHYLSAHAFDVVLFQDRHALGHASLVAKACGVAFTETVLGVVAFGSLGLAHKISGGFPREIDDVIVEYMERRAIELAAIIISRSNAITDWIMTAGLHLAKAPIAWPAASDALDAQGNWWRRTLDQLAPLERRPTTSIAAGDTPDTTVIITHWEQPKLVHDNLQALAVQNDKSFEVIVIDDGSSSVEALRNLDTLENRYRDLNLKLIRQSNRYVGAARNAAIRATKTKFVILLDDDNVPFPDMVRMFRLAVHTSGADIVTCAIRHFHNPVGPPELSSSGDSRVHHFSAGPLLAGAINNCFGDASGIYRRDVFARIGGFHEQYGVGFADWDLHFRTVAAGGALLSLPIPLVWYRVRPDSMLNRVGLYSIARVMGSAVQQVSGSALAPLADYLIGSNDELNTRKAEVQQLSGRLTRLETDLARCKHDLACLWEERDSLARRRAEEAAEQDRGYREVEAHYAVAVRERDALIAERDSLARRRAEEAAEQDRAYREVEAHYVAAVRERDALIAERDTLARRRGEEAAERDRAYREVEAHYVAAVRERDALIAERDQLAIERDRLSAAHTELSVTLDTVLTSRSWRMTAPLRNISTRFSKPRG